MPDSKPKKFSSLLRGPQDAAEAAYFSALGQKTVVERSTQTMDLNRAVAGSLQSCGTDNNMDLLNRLIYSQMKIREEIHAEFDALSKQIGDLTRQLSNARGGALSSPRKAKGALSSPKVADELIQEDSAGSHRSLCIGQTPKLTQTPLQTPLQAEWASESTVSWAARGSTEGRKSQDSVASSWGEAPSADSRYLGSRDIKKGASFGVEELLAPIESEARSWRPSINALSKEDIIEALDSGELTKELLDTHGYDVFNWKGGGEDIMQACVTTWKTGKEEQDSTDAFIAILEREGTKEAAEEVAAFLSLDNFTVDGPIQVHVGPGAAARAQSAKRGRSTARSTTAQKKRQSMMPNTFADRLEFLRDIPAKKANLDCDDVRHLLRMYRGSLAPKILDSLFVPVQLCYTSAGESGIEVKNAGGSWLEYILNKLSRTHESHLPYLVRTARLLDGELRTYSGRAIELVNNSDWNSPVSGAKACNCKIFPKPGLKTLVPQKHRDRVVGGGNVGQALALFHERRQVQVYYGVLNIHEDSGCFESLIENHNYQVFEHVGCQAIISHVLGEVIVLNRLNLLGNVWVVMGWIGYSYEMQWKSAELRHGNYTKLLGFCYIMRFIQFSLRAKGMHSLGMARHMFSSLKFWWQALQFSFLAYICVMVNMGEKGVEDRVIQIAVSVLIVLQWLQSMFDLCISRTFGECILPIMSAMMRANVLNFILVCVFFTFAMSHALYNLGLHGFGESLMLVYRLGVLGDFDLAELDGTDLYFTTEKGSNDLVASTRGSSKEDQAFIKFFVLIVSIFSTVLLMNVLIGVLSNNFHDQYVRRSQLYWKNAGRSAMHYAQQWEGLRHLPRLLRRRSWQPVLSKVTVHEKGEDESTILYNQTNRIFDLKYLWVSAPKSNNEEQTIEEHIEGQIKEMKEFMESHAAM